MRLKAERVWGIFAALVAAIFMLNALVIPDTTPVGLQCPTASVQSVTVAVRDCCGKIVGFSARAPKPGDKDFVQCRCAEKNNTRQKATISTKVQAIPFVCLILDPATKIADLRHRYTYHREFDSVEIAPPLLPPVMA